MKYEHTVSRPTRVELDRDDALLRVRRGNQIYLTDEDLGRQVTISPITTGGNPNPVVFRVLGSGLAEELPLDPVTGQHQKNFDNADEALEFADNLF